MRIKRSIIAFFVIFNILSLFAIASEIEELVESLGEPKYRAKQLYQGLQIGKKIEEHLQKEE